MTAQTEEKKHHYEVAWVLCNQWHEHEEECPICEGFDPSDEEEKCYRCGGKGEITVCTRSIDSIICRTDDIDKAYYKAEAAQVAFWDYEAEAFEYSCPTGISTVEIYEVDDDGNELPGVRDFGHPTNDPNDDPNDYRPDDQSDDFDRICKTYRIKQYVVLLVDADFDQRRELIGNYWDKRICICGIATTPESAQEQLSDSLATEVLDLRTQG